MQSSKILLPYPEECIHGTFVRRVKRFSVETRVNGKEVWAHTNNSGSMLGLTRPGSPVYLSPAANPKRKLKFTLETITINGTRVGVNTLTPNRILKAAFEAQALTEFQGFTHFRPEAKIGDSRLDALLTAPNGQMYVEAKNVTLVEDSIAAFPDAVTLRGQKHLRELITLADQGIRVASFYFIQRTDAQCFAPADYVDPEFAKLFYLAKSKGVEIWPYVASISDRGIGISHKLPLAPEFL